ncbi:hypothetical protein B0H10DRAFT_1937729 [Mycena sp. CBHHK59/15]|nr:hypothetical protein B0H10DRAFT_1937729 [Mycena sp. CBHHK59/15]
MPPRTQCTAEPDPTPPTPAGNPPPVTRHCQALPPDLAPPNPAAASHAARGSQRNTVTAQGEPSPPVRASSSSEQARGFAPLTCTYFPLGNFAPSTILIMHPSIASQQRINPGFVPLPRKIHNRLLIHSVQPARPTNALPQQTPGRAAANRLLSRLNQHSQMASPGPPVWNPSDDKSDSSLEEDAPVARPWLAGPRLQPFTSLHSDSEEDSAPESRLSGSCGRWGTTAHAQHSDAGTPSVPRAHSEGAEVEGWRRYNVDQDKYAWAGDVMLKENTKSADCQAFFREHIEHRGYKCSLCP